MTSELIRDIYAAALDEVPWKTVVEGTARLLDATSAFLITPFVPRSDGGLMVTSGVPTREAEQYVSDVGTVDLWYHELLRRHGRLSTGLLWQSVDLVSERELLRSRFYSDYLRPCDIGLNMGVMIGDGMSEWLPLVPMCLFRPVGAEPFTQEQRAQLSELSGHLTRALSVRQRLQEAEHGAAALALERVSTAVVALSRERQILLANPAAEALFAKSGFSLVREGRLSAADPAQRAVLDQALTACSTYRFDDRLSLSVRLAGSPGSGVVARLAPPPGSVPKGGRVAAIAFIAREGESAQDLRSVVKTLYGLSASEAELVRSLADGLTAEDFAELRGVGIATVRTQLRSVFSKTGTRRQSDLLRLVYSIAR